MPLTYRPWGKFRWLLNKFHSPQKWAICGCISTEERTLASLKELFEICKTPRSHKISDCFFLQINDPVSRYTDEAQRRKQGFQDQARQIRKIKSIEQFDLFHHNSEDVISFFDGIAQHDSKNIILDISCMPKRYFFPFIKRLHKYRERIENLIVVNTIPKSYPNDPKTPLSEQYENWRELPLFEGERFPEEKQYKNVLLGVGHLPMGALEQTEAIGSSSNIHLYFPFPGSTSSFEPTWQFVHKIEEQIPGITEKIRMTRVSANDTSKLFSFLKRDTDNGSEYSIILPYGPKPLSLAMALFACKHPKHPVFYTQPRVYNPDYSIGVKEENNLPVIHAYVVIGNGKCYYW